MLFTGKDKVSLVLPIFFLSLLIYLSNLIYDHTNQNTAWRENFGLAKRDLVYNKDLTALILGGSNVAYSLEASLLDTTTRYTWFNLGLSSESFSDKNYWEFVSHILSNDQRNDIQLVVYSSVSLLRHGYLLRRSNDNKDLWGNRPFSFVPDIALAERLKNYLFSNGVAIDGYPLPLSSGDFDFNFKICDQNYTPSFERELDWDLTKSWLISQITSLENLFPNANIVFNIPSEYYGSSYDEKLDKAYLSKLTLFFDKEFSNKIKLFVQPRYVTKNLTCDHRHHASAEGRIVSTKQISQYITETF